MWKAIIAVTGVLVVLGISWPAHCEDVQTSDQKTTITITIDSASKVTVASNSGVVSNVPVQVISPSLVASAKPSEPGKPYTSVIIDVTGYKLDRCMSPKIRKADGKEVWGTLSVDIDFAQEMGIVGYCKTIDDARKSSRCGSNPMIIKAIDRAGGKFNSDPVISDPDAALLIAEDAKGGFLKKFNVIFIKDGKL